MNQKIFRKTITMLEHMYRDKYDESVIKFIWKKIKGCTDEEWEDVIGNITESFKPTQKVPLPIVPDFIKHLFFSVDERVKTAIEKVKYAAFKVGQYDSITFGDLALHRTIGYYGGWPIVALWGENDWQFKEKGFAETYKAFSKTSKGPSGYLLGINEDTNIKSGHEFDDKGKKRDKFVRAKLPWSNFQIEDKTEKKIQIDFNDVVKGVE